MRIVSIGTLVRLVSIVSTEIGYNSISIVAMLYECMVN